MSDYNSSLPVRTEANGDVAVKVVDGAIPSQELSVDAAGKVSAKLSDGAGTEITSQANGAQQALDVGVNVAGVQVDPRNTQDGAGNPIDSTLVNSKQRLDVDLASEGTDGAVVPFGTVQVGGSDGTNLQALSVDLNGKLKVNLFDENGLPFSASNALPVSIATAVLGTAVNDYKNATSVAAAGVDNHDYTVTALNTLTLSSVNASASGKAKMDIQVETGIATGIFTTYFTQFNSTAETNMEIVLTDSIQVGPGIRVRVVMTNRDNQAQDLYSTISGTENL